MLRISKFHLQTPEQSNRDELLQPHERNKNNMKYKKYARKKMESGDVKSVLDVLIWLRSSMLWHYLALTLQTPLFSTSPPKRCQTVVPSCSAAKYLITGQFRMEGTLGVCSAATGSSRVSCKVRQGHSELDLVRP